MTLSSGLMAFLLKRVSIFFSFASLEGTILIMSPAGMAVKPCTSRTDSKTLYASLTEIFFGETMVTFPLTPLFMTKFLPVNSLINLINTRISTSLKSMVICLGSSEDRPAFTGVSFLVIFLTCLVFETAFGDFVVFLSEVVTSLS